MQMKVGPSGGLSFTSSSFHGCGFSSEFGDEICLRLPQENGGPLLRAMGLPALLFKDPVSLPVGLARRRSSNSVFLALRRVCSR